ncbi:TonB-dependent receptor [Algoriphagus vanfongensis]|uniref:TonB-dependent receptor n=1 Tax=Algoriphagus vanfongensis TaxID=426371 RepID=UPI00047AD942|nr:TonB-dependent receptor [Algoriphagus vanfongensis]
MRSFYFLIIALLITTTTFAQKVVLKGSVIDVSTKEALPFVTIRVGENAFTISDETGNFTISLPNGEWNGVILTATFVGKSPRKIALKEEDFTSGKGLIIYMEDNDLFMDEVTVSAVRDEENVSASAFKLDRTTIEQSQSNSLGELLKLIPGQTITNPQLQGAQTINFRGSLSSQQSLNNAFGIGLVINGNAVDNNSNMQGLSPTTAGIFRSFGSTSFGSNNYATGDNAGGGFDLRQIPVGNIEKVEVIQGVASAQYGDISDGAIIIETAAGKSPLNFNVRQGAGNTNLSLSKGIQVNEKQSFFFNLDYLNSNPDRRDKIKSYNRIAASVLWDQYFGENKQIKNSLNLSFNTNLDDFKIDPDFGTEKKVYYQNTSLSLSNRTSFYLKSKLADDMRVSFGASVGKSLSYLDQFVNPGVLPVTAATEAGVNIGTFHPSSYRSERRIKGLPVNFSINTNFHKAFKASQLSHTVAYGLNLKYNGNFGDGRVFDPMRPMRFAGASTNERPMSYKEISPELWQFGAFVEDRMSGRIWDKQFNLSLGVRGDVQLSKLNLSPRINGRLALKENLNLTMAYGLAFKAPGLVHLYPGPQYEDFTLLNYFNGLESESLYLVYTHLVPNAATGLKSMRSDTKELGMNTTFGQFNLSLTAFQKSIRDGFSINSNMQRIELPDYEIVEVREGQKPIFQRTGTFSPVLMTEREVSNSAFNDNMGLEMIFSVKTIQSIRTSFQLNLSWYQSESYMDRETLTKKPNWQETDEIWYGVYDHTKSRSGNSTGLLTINHHLSRLGLLFTIRSQAFITTYTRSFDASNQAIAYLDSNLIRHEIPESERDSPDYAVINREPSEGEFYRKPDFVYFNFHMNLSKNLGKDVRFSFFANNFLNIRPEVINTEGLVEQLLNQEPYFGLELNYKLK